MTKAELIKENENLKNALKNILEIEKEEEVENAFEVYGYSNKYAYMFNLATLTAETALNSLNK